MPTDPKPPAKAPEATDDVEKFLAERKAVEDHRQALIKEVLQQKETAIKAFDDKLEKFGYDGHRAPKYRSHHGKHDADKKASE